MAWTNLLEIIYPIGSIYISTANVSPASLIGGQWTAIQGAVLRGQNTEEQVGYIGNDTHILTTTEMPSHQHDLGMHRSGTEAEGYALLYTPNAPNMGGFENRAIVSSSPGDVGNAWAIATGGGQEHSIVQRSYNCYIWYRTA